MSDWLNKVIRNAARVKGLYKINYGFCHICQSKAVFIAVDKWLRDNYCCVKCLSIPRQRAIVKVINELLDKNSEMIVHESSPSGPSSSFFKNNFDNYSSSQYFIKVQPGDYYNGVRCENLEALTFEDNKFDLFITQDVMEHVFNPEKAFGEIARVLKPGGMYVFTVPFYKDNEETEFRAKLENNVVNYLKESQYHKNPVDPEGSLVTVDYGRDLPRLINEWSGLYTTIYRTIDKYYGLDGEFIEVFVSMKQ